MHGLYRPVTHYTYIFKAHYATLTPSNYQEEPPPFGEFAEDHHQHEIEHDSLTHHPAEG